MELNKNVLRIDDSETILIQKFLQAGIEVKKGGLNKLSSDILEIVKQKFKEEIDRDFKVSDILNEEKGLEIFQIYNKYFGLDFDMYNLRYFLIGFLDPDTVSLSWIRNNKDDLCSEFNLTNYELSEKDIDLLPELYLLKLYDDYFQGWERSSLYFISDYFTQTRGARLYSNKTVRKLLSLEPHLSLFSDDERLLFLQNKKFEYTEIIENDQIHNYKERGLRKAVEVFERAIEVINNK